MSDAVRDGFDYRRGRAGIENSSWWERQRFTLLYTE